MISQVATNTYVYLHFIPRNCPQHIQLYPLHIQTEVVDSGDVEGKHQGIDRNALDFDCAWFGNAIRVCWAYFANIKRLFEENLRREKNWMCVLITISFSDPIENDGSNFYFWSKVHKL